MVLEKLIRVGEAAKGRGPSVTVSVVLPVDVLARLDDVCEEVDCPRSAAIRQLVIEGVEKLEAEWTRATNAKLEAAGVEVVKQPAKKSRRTK